MVARDDPRPARAVQAHGRAGLLGDRAQLRDGRPRSTCDCERETGVGEQRVSCGPSRAVDEHRHALGQACFGAGGFERVFDDGPSRAQGIGADPEHDRVAGTDDAAGVGEHVRAPLEHEAHRAETGTHHIDPPAGMVDRLDDLPSSRRRVAPGAQPGDHVGPHPVAQHEAGDRAAACAGVVDVGGVGVGDGGERGIVGQAGGEAVVERGDGTVGDRAHGGEGLIGAADGVGGDLPCVGRDVDELAGGLHDDEAVAGHERIGERRRDRRHPIAAVDDGHARGERFETLRLLLHGGRGYAVAAPTKPVRGHRAGE